MTSSVGQRQRWQVMVELVLTLSHNKGKLQDKYRRRCMASCRNSRSVRTLRERVYEFITPERRKRKVIVIISLVAFYISHQAEPGVPHPPKSGDECMVDSRLLDTCAGPIGSSWRNVLSSRDQGGAQGSAAWNRTRQRRSSRRRQ